MRLRRRLPIIAGVLLVAVAVAVVVVLRKHAPPEAARLLPQGDGFVYINLKRLRHANLPGQLPPVVHDPEYEHFIQATGFQFENDLEEAAFAIHYPPGNAAGREPRYSEVFVGKIQGERLRDYLRRISSSVENYRSTDIFSIPLEGRTLRVAILGVDTVAASNQNDPGTIRAMIDRSRKLASPFGGPALLRRYYKYVPLTDRYVPYASLAWAVFRVDPAARGPAAGPFGLSFLFTKPAVVVASVRYFRAVHLRAEAFTDDEDEAKRVTEQLNALLNFFRSAEGAAAGNGQDPDLKKLLDSLKAHQSGDRAILTAAAPVPFIRKALTGPPEANGLGPLLPK